MSYNTGVLNPVVEQKYKQVEAAQEVYKEVLKSLGFEPGLGQDKDKNGSGECLKVPGHVFEEHWKVTVNASSGYEITLNFDAILNFLSMSERNLSWVHATVFHGKEVSSCQRDFKIFLNTFFIQMESTKKVLIPENDIRFVIQTADKVDCNSNLFK